MELNNDLKPILSFVVIGYNVEEYIEECLTSVSRQTITNIEIIFVNDGSTDGTLSIVEKLKDNDNRIQIINQKNAGANSARISGFLNSIGKYITFVDGDDFVNEYLAEVCVNILEKKPNLDFVFFDYTLYNQKKYSHREIKEIGNTFNSSEYLNAVAFEIINHFIWARVFKKDFLHSSHFIKIPTITVGDDLAANIRFSVNMKLCEHVDKALYHYRIVENSVSRKDKTKSIELLEAIRDMEVNLTRAGINHDIIQEIIEFNYFRSYFIYVVKNKNDIDQNQRLFIEEFRKRKNEILKNKSVINKISSLKFTDRFLFKFYMINERATSKIVNKFFNIFDS
ncbi:glycosyltransferase [Enterococcus casseliflavus]|uniref:glycosyltransferase family 2 protein n=1 Tax=Enterococcus casseliflavus TaxID=37734 RepID=UPI002954AFE8|nr:glycosyltransferase [Enterococcus casseliflavus]MDV7712269.1 glycosyltransferase [Enterococcus casseliflavus]